MPRVTNQMLDFSGGVWRSRNQNSAPKNTVRQAWNCRVDEYGDLTKRTGTQKLHETAFTATDVVGSNKLQGLYFFERPDATDQAVAIYDGDLYYWESGDADFTLGGSPTSLSSTLPASMVDWDTGSSHKLYFTTEGASAAELYSWDGSSVVNIGSDLGSDAPAIVEVYKQRLWVSVYQGNGLYASKVNDPTIYDTTNGAIFAQVGRSGDNEITGLRAIGESLLVFHRNSIARISGTDPNALNIDQDSEGVSAEVGALRNQGIAKFGDSLFFVSEEGPYVATEGGVRYVGAPVEHWFLRASRDSNLAWPVAVHHRGRREIHVWFRPKGDLSGQQRDRVIYTGAGTTSYFPTIGFIWNYVADVWTGPISIGSTYGVNRERAVTSACSWQDNSAGEESVLYGVWAGGDGEAWVVTADPPYLNSDGTNVWLDMRESDNTGGESYGATIELPEEIYGNPDYVKLFNPTQWLSVDIDVSDDDENAIQIKYKSELSAEKTLDINVTALGEPGWDEYRTRDFKFRPALRGRRPIIQIIFNNDGYASLKGVTLTAEIGRRAA